MYLSTRMKVLSKEKLIDLRNSFCQQLLRLVIIYQTFYIQIFKVKINSVTLENFTVITVIRFTSGQVVNYNKKYKKASLLLKTKKPEQFYNKNEKS